MSPVIAPIWKSHNPSYNLFQNLQKRLKNPKLSHRSNSHIYSTKTQHHHKSSPRSHNDFLRTCLQQNQVRWYPKLTSTNYDEWKEDIYSACPPWGHTQSSLERVLSCSHLIWTMMTTMMIGIPRNLRLHLQSDCPVRPDYGASSKVYQILTTCGMH